jgi:hypothetical protein
MFFLLHKMQLCLISYMKAFLSPDRMNCCLNTERLLEMCIAFRTCFLYEVMILFLLGIYICLLRYSISSLSFSFSLVGGRGQPSMFPFLLFTFGGVNYQNP